MRARYFVEENGTEGELRVSERRATEVAVVRRQRDSQPHYVPHTWMLSHRNFEAPKMRHKS
jgi:hypothetical protein